MTTWYLMIMAPTIQMIQLMQKKKYPHVLPGTHTIHIFQSLDMVLFHPLNAHFYRLTQNLKLVRYRWKEPINYCKIKFTKLLKEPWESMTVMLIKSVSESMAYFRYGGCNWHKSNFQQFIKSTSTIIKYIKSKFIFIWRWKYIFNYCTDASTQVPQPQSIAVSLNPLISSGTVSPTIRPYRKFYFFWYQLKGEKTAKSNVLKARFYKSWSLKTTKLKKIRLAKEAKEIRKKEIERKRLEREQLGQVKTCGGWKRRELNISKCASCTNAQVHQKCQTVNKVYW